MSGIWVGPLPAVEPIAENCVNFDANAALGGNAFGNIAQVPLRAEFPLQNSRDREINRKAYFSARSGWSLAGEVV
jgi:hypothetical protein